MIHLPDHQPQIVVVAQTSAEAAQASPSEVPLPYIEVPTAEALQMRGARAGQKPSGRAAIYEEARLAARGLLKQSDKMDTEPGCDDDSPINANPRPRTIRLGGGVIVSLAGSEPDPKEEDILRNARRGLI